MSNKQEDINKEQTNSVGFTNLYKHIKISVKTLDKIIVGLVIALVIAIIFALTHQGFIIEFDGQGGTSIESQKLMHGDKVTYEESSRDGYIFDGWALDVDCKNKYNFENEVSSSFKLYACWIEK